MRFKDYINMYFFCCKIIRLFVTRSYISKSSYINLLNIKFNEYLFTNTSKAEPEKTKNNSNQKKAFIIYFQILHSKRVYVIE
jgi:hypothetical protein